MLQLVMEYYHQGVKALDRGVTIRTLTTLPVRDLIARLKFIPENEFAAAVKNIREAFAEQLKPSQTQGVK